MTIINDQRSALTFVYWRGILGKPGDQRMTGLVIGGEFVGKGVRYLFLHCRSHNELIFRVLQMLHAYRLLVVDSCS